MRPRGLAGLAVLALVSAIYLLDPRPAALLRGHVLDFEQSLGATRADATAPVVLIDIDETALAHRGQWPWPRDMLADLTDRLIAAGARVIAFDMVFPEPDRMGPERDGVFAVALARAPTVLAQAASLEAQDGPPPKTTIRARGGDLGAVVPPWAGAVRNQPVLERAARGLGYVSIAAEPDGIVRRLPLVLNAGGAIGLALSVEIVRLYRGAPLVDVAVGPDGITQFAIGDLAVPTDGQGRIWLPATSRAAAPRHSADAVLAGRLGPGSLAGRIALVGASAEGLRDLRTTPLADRVPGMEIHADAIEAMLAGRVAMRPAFAAALELALLAVFGLILCAAMPRLPAARAISLLAVVVLGVGALGPVLHQGFGLLIDGVTPALGILASGTALLATAWTGEERRRRHLRHAFDHYLAPAMIERLLSDPQRLRLGGEVREVTILFADIRGFTALAESLREDPEELTRLMNRVFTVMTQAVLSAQGTIDKLVGDSLIALWNAPLDQPDHATRAAQAARALVAAVEGLGDPRIAVSVGLNTGACFVGNMGAEGRFDYTALGDPVNVAARLEAAAKERGLAILFGPETARRLPEGWAVSIGALSLRGRAGEIEGFALAAPSAAPPTTPT